MAGRRVVYGAALLAALAFQIFYDGYLAQYLLFCVIALPLLSLLLSLPGALRLRLHLQPSAPQLTAGQKGEWTISARETGLLPVARLTVRLTFRNTLTGAASSQRLRVTGLAGGQRRVFPLDGSHCGALTCQVSRARALDLLGLFAFPLPLPPAARALVLPEPAPMEEVADLEPLLAQAGSRPGRGQQLEDYELRDYRPGDSPRAVHWKMSAKHDELVVREHLKGILPQLVLAFDLYGTPERLDRVLARLWTASSCLISRGLPHTISWTDADGRLQAEPVFSRDHLLRCMVRIFSRQAPAANPRPSGPAPDTPGHSDTLIYRIRAGEGEAT